MISSFIFFVNNNSGDNMKIILGYVSISLTLGITTSSTITLTKFNSNKDIEHIYKVINKNLDCLKENIIYNIKNEVKFYRMTSKLIPLATLEDFTFDYITPFLNKYKDIGVLANSNNIRIDMHPDQYCVLNSTNPKTVENSFRILNYHRKILKALNFNSPKLILHVGSSQGGKKASMTRFINNFNKLDDELKKMIVLENDDKVFNVADTLYLCQKLKIPMVFDYHHHLCNNCGLDIKKYLSDIIKTWDGEYWPVKMHFSSPKSKLKKEYRSHHDYIDVDKFNDFIQILKEFKHDIYIMLEAKQKDEALFRLVRALKYKCNYQFVNDTSFLV